VVTDDEVVAPRVEVVDVESGERGRQPRAELAGEDVVARPLGGADVGAVAGEDDGITVTGGGQDLGAGPTVVCGYRHDMPPAAFLSALL
jgi:hypothetical protein